MMKPNMPIKAKKFTPPRHFLAVFFISFIWGVVGADRMYIGKWGTGLLKLVTGGGLGLWAMIDLLLIMTGMMRDKQGREFLEFHKYKAFAFKTILVFAIALGAATLIMGVVTILSLSQFLSDMQNGTVPGLDMLRGSNASPDQLQQILNP